MARSTCLRAMALCAGLLLALPAPALEIAVRDAVTGAPLEASLELAGGRAGEVLSLGGELREVAAPAERSQAVVRAAGHADLGFTLDPATTVLTLMLDPLEPPAEFARLEAEVAAQGGNWLQGWVRRERDGAPLADALIRVAGETVSSDAAGYFELRLPECGVGVIERFGIEAEHAGTGSQRIDGVACVPGIQRRVIALREGAAGHTHEEIGAIDREGAAGAGMDAGEARASPLLQPETPIGALLAPGIAPPASIRVGFADAACTQSCCTGSCTHTCTYSLETYVRRGLHGEWIASWNQQSLRAGSIAYRSYGAWRVANPIRPGFDICSSACCQVNTGSTQPATDNAVARTPGIMLTRNETSVASSEYSAENNAWDDPNDGLSCSNSDLSCGNGFNGSPATGWPCLADSVGAGHGCFGHGRGMSQWGTKRWGEHASTPRSWKWIVDHYYNDLGNGSGLRTAVMTSPLLLSGITATPGTVQPGESFQIGAQAQNTAGATHAHLLIGASLYRSGVGYIDDSPGDAPLVLDAGTHAVGRTFAVPDSAAPGVYDVLVSLYLDVDENGAISGADLALALDRRNGAVTIFDDRIFRDDFEAD